MNPLDVIELVGLRASGFHGVLEHERIAGQVFVIDVKLHLPLKAAAESDDLSKTVDYGELASRIVAAVERDPVDLIETVAERVAALVLENELVQLVWVTVHKPSAPIVVPFDDVRVTIIRGRQR